jgi:hypothetical protein
MTITIENEFSQKSIAKKLIPKKKGTRVSFNDKVRVQYHQLKYLFKPRIVIPSAKNNVG